ncbi:P-loop containing nucleoside triphosphate hydrolase protein [Artomyces pyxidatus]|uniref:P-loop containing nucleoside triphosphate hydrolase protein n=1 Tax=Artomyces pyxidatus TaxID=48021 RepID=A0ACB8TJW3_9AGAM|nr:P-loop containing nucleoside triphosphate hydrolase protein [Artomyces pyxidatus]
MANKQSEESVWSDAFVKVSFQAETDGDPLSSHWTNQGSAKHSGPAILISQTLQKLYPNHSIVLTRDFRLNILQFPAVTVKPLSPSDLVTNVGFIPLTRGAGPRPGVLVDSVEYGAFELTWQDHSFLLYIAKWPLGFSEVSQHFILYEGPETISRELLLSAGIFADQLHDEIWVFNQGFWSKDASLWREIQKASWSDVILEEDFKAAVQKDVHGFFSSEWTYKNLSLPWKRGLIMYGPPGNGKTISIKIIMKECDAKGYRPMYVKSFQSWQGEEGAMATVFAKARQNAPCVVILEDLDSLINDRNRSFFLNELDGLSGNDGLLVIGTTNHFDRLDPGLSTRPSRFDRKYLYDDPNRNGRVLYVQYWQSKLKHNDAVIFPDSLVEEVADLTDKFSFAYLKEAFVSSLVTFMTDKEDGKDVHFESVIKGQIKTLRKQLDKGAIDRIASTQPFSTAHVAPLYSSAMGLTINQTGAWMKGESTGRDVRPLLDAIAQRLNLTEVPNSRDDSYRLASAGGSQWM